MGMPAFVFTVVAVAHGWSTLPAARRRGIARRGGLTMRLASKPIHLVIDGASYDAGRWADSHPGGRWLLAFSNNTDVTALFHSIHLPSSEKARTTLAALPRVEDVALSRPFEWIGASVEPLVIGEPTPFALDLAEMIDARFLQKGRSLKATRAHWAMVCVALMLAASAWCGWSEGSASACLVLPLAQWLLAALTTHEALHGSLSSDARVNFCCQFFALPVMYNPLTWMPEHLLSHHQHTNDAQLDVDLHQWAPVRLSAQQRAVPARGEEGRGAFLGTTGFPQFVLKSALSTVGQAVLQPMRALTDAPTPNFDRNITPAPKCVPKWAIALSLLPPALVAAWHPSLWLLGLASGDSHVDLETLARGLFLELWPWVATSLIWSTMTQVSHIQQACQTNGDQRDDFWKAQVETALDYSVTCAAATPLTAGLNMQGLHHALPNVCQCHFPEIYPEYLQICKKHDVTPNHSENIFTAAASLLTFVADVNRDPEPATTNEAPLQAVATL